MTIRISYNIEQLFSLIEDPELTAMLSVVNSVSSFINQAKYERNFLQAKDMLLSDPETNYFLIEKRVETLLNVENDISVSHPYDIALAVYLLLIKESTVSHIEKLVQIINDKNIPNFWWVNLISSYICSKISTSGQISIKQILSDNISEFNMTPKKNNNAFNSETKIITSNI
jgi:hypothetical protein